MIVVIFCIFSFVCIASPIISTSITDLTDEGRDVANFTCQATGELVPSRYRVMLA